MTRTSHLRDRAPPELHGAENRARDFLLPSGISSDIWISTSSSASPLAYSFPALSQFPYKVSRVARNNPRYAHHLVEEKNRGFSQIFRTIGEVGLNIVFTPVRESSSLHEENK
jgi:hypothetical protein